MQEIYLYSTRFCPFCARAKQILEGKGLKYRDIPVDAKPALREEMMRLSGRHTVPQIWVGKTHVGGCDELMVLERSGKLDALLASEGIAV
ncbi:MAG: glutaredoxin 3 [Oceanicoccus sp.]|jgi:glutaredoxin 3